MKTYQIGDKVRIVAIDWVGTVSRILIDRLGDPVIFIQVDTEPGESMPEFLARPCELEPVE
jgi:hypothetical protein